MPITHVIFDLDGTLIDTEALYTKNIQKILDPYNVEFTYEWKREMMGRKPHEAAAKLINSANINMTPDEFVEKLSSLMDFTLVPLIDGVWELVEELFRRGIKMCIATGSTEESYDVKLRPYPRLRDLMCHAVCSGSDPRVKRGKPYPDIFIEAKNRFDDSVNIDNILVFEDAFNGVEAALGAGMKVVWMPDERETVSSPPGVWRINKLREFELSLLD